MNDMQTEKGTTPRKHVFPCAPELMTIIKIELTPLLNGS